MECKKNIETSKSMYFLDVGEKYSEKMCALFFKMEYLRAFKKIVQLLKKIPFKIPKLDRSNFRISFQQKYLHKINMVIIDHANFSYLYYSQY